MPSAFFRLSFVFFCIVLLFEVSLAKDSDKGDPKLAREHEVAILGYEEVFNRNELTTLQKAEKLVQLDSVFRKYEDWVYSIASLAGAINLLQQERDYQRIDELSKDAVTIARTYLKEDHFFYGPAINLRGVSSFLNKSDYKNAISLFHEAIRSDKKANNSLLGTSEIYLNLGICYQKIGDYDSALDQFDSALRIQLDSSMFNDYMIPNILNNRGLCFRKKKEYGLAIIDFKKGINYAKAIKPNRRDVDQIVLYLIQNLASVYLEMNQLELAKKYIDQALEFQKNKAFIREAYSYELQGDWLLKQNNIARALQAFQKNATYVKKEYKGFGKHPEIGNVYFQIGNAWMANSDLDSALYYYQQALINNSVSFNSENPFDNPTQENLVNLLYAIETYEEKAEALTGKFELTNDLSFLMEAAENYELAFDAINATRNSFKARGSKYLLSENVIPVFEKAIEVTMKLFELTRQESWVEKGFYFAEANKAAALFEEIQKSEALSTTGIPDSLKAEEYNLNVEVAFYQKLIYEARQKKENLNPDRIKELEKSLFALKEQHKLLINEFEINYPEYFSLKYQSSNIDLREIKENLQNVAILEFFVGLKTIFVFTITEKSTSCVRLNKSPEFEEDIEALKSIISTPPTSKNVLQSLKEFSKTSNRIYKNYFERSIKDLPENIRHLIFIPDDILAYIPFSVLVDSNDKPESFKRISYLNKRFAISYNYSVALWSKQIENKPSAAIKDFIGFAPDFNELTEEKLAPLTCNETEVNQIRLLFSKQDVKLAGQAKVDYFTSVAADYKIIHLATHSSLDNQNSSFNRIYFSDNYLNQNDLYQLSLDSDLVVLSACNTGTGQLKKGEGVMSLSRGFVHAGCSSMLMSLWAVDDCTTAELLTDYYKNLKSKLNKDVALKRSKTDYLDKTDDILQAHPYYWAAFIQYGNTNPISLTSDHKYKWVLYLLMIVVAGLGFNFLLKKRNV